MKFVRFNAYLCLAVALLAQCGCQTAKSKQKKEFSYIELHLEENADGSSDNAPVSIYRGDPSIQVNVNKGAFLTGQDLLLATVVDQPGGFAIRLDFNERGASMLDMFTSSNPGKRIGIFCFFGEQRWVAAPVIRRRIANGVLVFTPDASREEADRLVKGLNLVTAELRKQDKM